MYMYLYVCLIKNGFLYNIFVYPHRASEMWKFCETNSKNKAMGSLWFQNDTYRWHYKQCSVERLHFVIWSTALAQNEAFCLIWVDELFVSRIQVYSFVQFDQQCSFTRTSRLFQTSRRYMELICHLIHEVGKDSYSKSYLDFSRLNF